MILNSPVLRFIILEFADLHGITIFTSSLSQVSDTLTRAKLGATSHSQPSPPLLSRFIGMLTDSRSFMSFPRHEYFRRPLCNLLGTDVEAGLIPNDDALVGNMVKNICYPNAKAYLGLKVS